MKYIERNTDIPHLLLYAVIPFVPLVMVVDAWHRISALVYVCDEFAYSCATVRSLGHASTLPLVVADACMDDHHLIFRGLYMVNMRLALWLDAHLSSQGGVLDY